MNLAERLIQIEKLEAEMVRKAQPLVGIGSPISYLEFFAFGIVKRILAQAAGFRSLIGERNFPCAAAILRMQLDTAMRTNALGLVDDPRAFCEAVISGGRFDTFKDRDGIRLRDAYLRRKLSEKYPWVDEVYRQASDFVHLSGRHFFASIARTDDTTQMVYLAIGSKDPPRPEAEYYEIVDTFFEATKLAAMLVLALLSVRPDLLRSSPGTDSLGEPGP